MKRKILVAILAIAMIAGTLAAPLAQVFAAGTEKNVTGTWYGSSMGIPITMDVMENGTYKVSVDDGNEEEGVWTVENDEFVMDKDTDYEMSLQFDGNSIFLDDEDGINFEFEREPAEKETEEVKATEEPVETETEPATGEMEEQPEQTNHNEKILALYSQGKSYVEIAKDLGLGQGEVRRVVGLYKGVDTSEV